MNYRINYLTKFDLYIDIALLVYIFREKFFFLEVDVWR